LEHPCPEVEHGPGHRRLASDDTSAIVDLFTAGGRRANNGFVHGVAGLLLSGKNQCEKNEPLNPGKPALLRRAQCLLLEKEWLLR